jgi:hypothetical protein
MGKQVNMLIVNILNIYGAAIPPLSEEGESRIPNLDA